MRTGVARCERLAPSDIEDELGDGDSVGGGFSRLQSAGRGGLRSPTDIGHFESVDLKMFET